MNLEFFESFNIENLNPQNLQQQKNNWIPESQDWIPDYWIIYWIPESQNWIPNLQKKTSFKWIPEKQPI